MKEKKDKSNVKTASGKPRLNGSTACSSTESERSSTSPKSEDSFPNRSHVPLSEAAQHQEIVSKLMKLAPHQYIPMNAVPKTKSNDFVPRSKVVQQQSMARHQNTQFVPNATVLQNNYMNEYGYPSNGYDYQRGNHFYASAGLDYQAFQSKANTISYQPIPSAMDVVKTEANAYADYQDSSDSSIAMSKVLRDVYSNDNNNVMGLGVFSDDFMLDYGNDHINTTADLAAGLNVSWGQETELGNTSSTLIDL